MTTEQLSLVLGGAAVALLVGLVYLTNREMFARMAYQAFLEVEKTLRSAEGQAKMTAAVDMLVDALPGSILLVIDWVARARGISRDDLVRQVCQSLYERINDS